MALLNNLLDRIKDIFVETAGGATAVRVANPDGTTISGGSGGGDGAIVDGSNSAIKATVKDLTNSNPVTVAIVDTSGDQISSFGGGTQYTEGDTDSSITGTAMLMEGATNTLLPVQGTVADGILVNLGSNNDVAVTGTVAVTQSGTWDEVGINDSGNSITVDAPVDTPVFVRLSDGSSAIATLPVSLASVPSHAVTNAGTFAVQVDGAALTALQLIDDPVITDDGTFTPGATKVMMLGFEADETSTDSVDEGDAGAARMTLDRKQIVTVQPHTAGGLSVFNATSSDGSTALTNSAQAIKASAGQVYGWYIYNPNSSAQFVQFYNTAAASVTVGTTNPLFMLTIPASAAANVEFTNGITFTNAGFSCAATSTAGGNGAPSTALDVVIFYK